MQGSPTPSRPHVIEAEVRTEAVTRLEAAAANLSWALLGELEPAVAMAGAVRLIEQAQRFLVEAAAGVVVVVGT